MKTFIRTLFYYKRTALFVLLILSAATAFAQSGWTQVISPNPSATRNNLRGISGTSSSDIWTVGEQEMPAPLGDYITNTLVLHWDGNGWQQFTTPNPSASINDLHDVEMISPTDGWACGVYNISGTSGEGLMMKWDGSSWSQHFLPDPAEAVGLWALDAVDANNIWVVGWGADKEAYSAHYNGSSWTQITVPKVGDWRNVLQAVHGIAADDVWAVGYYNVFAAGDYFPMAMHWDGSTWTNFPLPENVANNLGSLQDVKMVSSNDVWAMGHSHNKLLHFDGTSWTEVSTPSVGAAFAVVGANDVWDVGNVFNHWDGTSWTFIEDLTNHNEPVLGSTLVLPNGEIWAAGRDAFVTPDLDIILTTLVYRYDGKLATAQIDSNDGGLVVYPNPVVDKRFNIVAKSEEGSYTLKLLNSVGQVILTRKINLSQSASTIDLPGNIVPGIYTLSLEKDEVKMVQRIVIR